MIAALATVSVSPTWKIVLPAIMAASVLAFALAMLLMSGDHRSRLERRLTGYVDEPEQPRAVARGEQMLAETRLVQDMAEFTGRIAERVGLLNRVEEKLEQADLPMRPTEAIFFYLAGVLVVLAGSLLLLGPPPPSCSRCSRRSARSCSSSCVACGASRSSRPSCPTS